MDYNSDLKLFGKQIGNDFYEGKITLPIILLYQKINLEERKTLKNIFDKNIRNQGDLLIVINLIKKYNIINDCYNKANYFINIASNALNIFEDSKEKEILLNLTYFSLERKY